MSTPTATPPKPTPLDPFTAEGRRTTRLVLAQGFLFASVTFIFLAWVVTTVSISVPVAALAGFPTLLLHALLGAPLRGLSQGRTGGAWPLLWHVVAWVRLLALTAVLLLLFGPHLTLSMLVGVTAYQVLIFAVLAPLALVIVGLGKTVESLQEHLDEKGPRL